MNAQPAPTRQRILAGSLISTAQNLSRDCWPPPKLTSLALPAKLFELPDTEIVLMLRTQEVVVLLRIQCCAWYS